MLPASIQLSHALEEDHEHIVCTSKKEKHLHEEEASDCSGFHKSLNITTLSFTIENDDINKHFFSSIFINKTKFFNKTLHSKKSSRGPPQIIA